MSARVDAAAAATWIVRGGGANAAVETGARPRYQRLHTFVLEGRDVVQWWTNTTNEEAKLLTEGCGVDFAGTITKHATYEGVDITTVAFPSEKRLRDANAAKILEDGLRLAEQV